MAVASLARGEMRGEKILLVEEDLAERAALRAALAQGGFAVSEASSAEEALESMRRSSPAAVLVDAAEGGMPAADLVERAASVCPGAVFVVATATAPPGEAVAAIRAGAESTLAKPLDAARALLWLEKALEKGRLRRQLAELREEAQRHGSLLGASREMREVEELVRRAGPTDASVLVRGEPGTGKEHVARALHEASPRRHRPFVRVSCAALSEPLLEALLFGREAGAFPEAAGREEGALERASGGTLFLREVSNLAPATQVKLLRVLQHGELERPGGREMVRVDARVVASTSRDLAAEVRAGRFRDDLYYRLDVVSVELPPLRQRKGDIPVLADRFVEAAGRALGKPVRGVTPGALSCLFAYDWPGNVRELENALERAARASAGGAIGARDLPPALHGAGSGERGASALIPGASLLEIEREAILRTLEQVNGSTARAAEVLGVSVRKIQYRLREYRTGRAGPRQADARPR
jgi:two-component system NtrC family response regulator